MRPQTFDAVYFTPFAPASNAELWQTEMLSRLSLVLKDDGRLVTYCVSRHVHETISAVGLCETSAGLASGKREVLIATKRS
jgi:tRNA U34 5-methylaminomethyl-2-thiouridine-forming methyltransferase MnmC